MAKEKGSKDSKGARASAQGASASSGAAAAPVEHIKPRMMERYRAEIVGELMKEFGYDNVMQVPRLEKVTLNMGLGEAVGNPNMVKVSVEELTVIAGQRAVITRSKKAIANFKLRAGLPIGCMVTLRRDRMWEFLDRLFSVAMPRIRDFKGLSAKAFDGRGNYTMGLREQIIFPEVNYDNVEKIKGLNVTITTTAKTDEEGRALLKHLGLPFRTT